MTKQEILDKIEELKKKKAKAEFDAKLQDVFQHSFKIMLNSVYGFTGTKFSPVFSRDIAESVTLTGQKTIKEMVRFTNKCLDKIGGTEEGKEDWVIAGDTDSVLGKSKISLNGRYITIEDAFKKFRKQGHSEILENGTEVAIPAMNTYLTDSLDGKSSVRNISRHKVRKQMYSITVPGKDPLIMTEDHSIMVQRDGRIIECKPSDIKETDFLIVKEA